MPKDERKVIVTGANGQLGQEVVRVFQTNWVVIPTDTNNLDITDKQKLEEFMTREKPDLVIHCAAWTDVDAAAQNPKAAMKVNAGGTKNICEVAKKVNAKVVYISTNEVFDGKKEIPYEEDDQTNPINIYSKSKLKGEQYCQKILGYECIIVRSSWLYGPASNNNFPNKILKKAKEQGFLKVVDDEIAVPTYTSDLADAVKKLVEKKVKGVFHLVNEGQASRYDWVREILKIRKLKIPLLPVKLIDFQRTSSPPEYSVLANIKAKSMGIVLRDWQLANKEYLQKN